VLILQQAALPGQMLAPGVVVDVSEATAAWLIEAGAAERVDYSSDAAHANLVLDGMLDVPTAAPRKRVKAQE
jgi:hypothetical protein